MIPISGVSTAAAQPLPAAEKALLAPKPEMEAQGRPPKPVVDEYIPEEKREPSGLYWMGMDESDRPKVYFDDPERAADAPERPEGMPDAEEPEQDKGAKSPDDKKEERCVGNTDKVDREIEKLKKKRRELEQRLSTETDEAKIKNLERQLAQVDQELRQKDNDAYRRQHAQVTRTS